MPFSLVGTHRRTEAREAIDYPKRNDDLDMMRRHAYSAGLYERSCYTLSKMPKTTTPPPSKKSSPQANRSRRRAPARFHVLAGSGHRQKPPVDDSYSSPNYASRNGETIQTAVVHNTDAKVNSALAHLTDPKSQVSAHYVVARDGTIYQLVDDDKTAWHSGDKTVNQQSIGIEIEAWKAATGLTAKQDASLVALVKYVMEAYGVPVASIIPHRKVKATDCPGWVWPKDKDLDDWKKKL